jgi:predicted metal-dependent hydrolase
MPEKMMTFRIDEKLHSEMKDRAKIEGLTVQGFLTKAIHNYLDKLLDEEEKARQAGIGRFRIKKGLAKRKKGSASAASAD